jgi:hypothetical protein
VKVWQTQGCEPLPIGCEIQVAITATEFAKSFERYMEEAKREPVAIIISTRCWATSKVRLIERRGWVTESFTASHPAADPESPLSASLSTIAETQQQLTLPA